MIKYKSQIKEIVIGRFTHAPNAIQIERAWSDAILAGEVGGDFKRKNLGQRTVERGYEIFVTRG